MNIVDLILNTDIRPRLKIVGTFTNDIPCQILEILETEL